MQKKLRSYIHAMPQNRQLMLLSLIFSAISPLCWWMISMLVPENWTTVALYLYLLLGAMMIFGTFAYIIGHFQIIMLNILEHDNLTVVLNQKAFFRRMEAVNQLGTRFSDRIAVIMIDIDNFKNINDRHSNHQVGSDVLKELAVLFKDCMRETDIVARFGGDEFVIGLPRITDKHHAELVGERLRKSVDGRLFHSRGNEFRVTISVGIVVAICSSGTRIEDLVQYADQMLYKAKHSGRNRVETLVLESENPVRQAK